MMHWLNSPMHLSVWEYFAWIVVTTVIAMSLGRRR